MKTDRPPWWMLLAVTPTRYRIVVKGRLTDSFASVFEDLSVEPLPGRTALEATSSTSRSCTACSTASGGSASNW